MRPTSRTLPETTRAAPRSAPASTVTVAAVVASLFTFGPPALSASRSVGAAPSGLVSHATTLTEVRTDTLQAATGTIRGNLELRLPRPRRTPNRYAGRGGPPARRVQELPAVVYLRGGPRAVPTGEAVMAQRDTVFEPGVLVVPVGAEVAFPNHDPFFHNVFSYSSPARFDLGRYPTGQSKSVTFDEPGLVKIYCEVHEFMRGAVMVTETGRHAVVGEGGAFRMDDVPAGEWTVVAWHADLGEVEATVTVPGDGAVDVELVLGDGDPR